MALTVEDLMPQEVKRSDDDLVTIRFVKNKSYAGQEYGPDYEEDTVAVREDWAHHFVGRSAAVFVEAEADDEPAGYSDLNKPELKALVEERQLEVEGTGADGNVVKSDLVEALEAADGED